MSELYQLPDGWEWKKLVDSSVCELIMGQSPSSDTYNSDGIGMPFFQGKTEFGEMYPTVSKYCTAPNKIAKVGDILLSVRAPVGPTNIANIECCIGRGLGAIRPNRQNTLTNYLLYFFRNFEIEISNKGKGSTFSAITKKELENTDIPIPPLPEQQRIVAKLDTLFEKIDKAMALHQKNIDETNVFMASVLNDVFGELEEKYPIKTIEEISSNIRYGYTDSAKDKGNAVFIRITDINKNGKFKNNFVYVDIDEKELKKYQLQKGDILVARSGATAGKVALFDLDLLSVFASYLIRIQPNEETDSSFFFYFCHSPKYWEQLNTIKVGGAQPNVNATNLKEIKLAVPPLQIQQKTVAYLDEISQKIEKVKTIQKEKMESLKALKASILDQAFRGEL